MKDPLLRAIGGARPIVITPYLVTVPPAAGDALGSLQQAGGRLDALRLGQESRGPWRLGRRDPHWRCPGRSGNAYPGTLGPMISLQLQALHGLGPQSGTQSIKQIRQLAELLRFAAEQ